MKPCPGIEAAARRASHRWRHVIGWACRSTNGRFPRHRRLVLKLARLAIELELSFSQLSRRPPLP